MRAMNLWLPLLLLGFAPSTLFAEEPADPRISPETLAAFEKLSFEHDGFTMPYRLMKPIEIEPGKEYPLLLFLHGYGERGEENQRQLIHGGGMFASEEFRKRHPAYIVVPQCPAGYEPGSVTNDPNAPPGSEAQRMWTWMLGRDKKRSIDLDGDPTPQLHAVRGLIDALRSQHPIDDRRLYVGGLSMGGYATWELILREPEFWAAAAPICGSGDPAIAGRLVGLPIWNFHGEADRVVPAERSREMVAAVEAAGGRVIYTEYEGVGHDSWSPTFASRQVWDWLFSQRR